MGTMQTAVVIVSFIADMCILFITIYTFYLTIVSRRVKFVSCTSSSSIFYGETIGFLLTNRTLHPICVNKIFVMKQVGEKFLYVNIANYNNRPLVMEAWQIKGVESEPYTKLVGYEGLDLWEGGQWVIGLECDSEVIWVKPYRKVSLGKAKRCYKKHAYDIVTVSRVKSGEFIVAESVEYVVVILMKDGTYKEVLVTSFGMMSESILGYNCIEPRYCKSVKTLKHHLRDVFGLKKECIQVMKVGQI